MKQTLFSQLMEWILGSTLIGLLLARQPGWVLASGRLREQGGANDRVFTKAARQAAHDLRSPLSALNMMVSTLPHVNEEKRQLLKDVIARINGIADELLEQSRMTALEAEAEENRDQGIPGQGECSIAEILGAIVAEKREETHVHERLQIVDDLDHAPEACANVNAGELKRVISNLVNNSIEAGSRRVGVSLRAYGSRLSIAVSDDGSGIPETVLARLTNGERVTFGKGRKGHGLGLSHARAVVQAMGGRLQIQSREGAGTLVTVSLPQATLTRRSRKSAV